MDCAGRGVEGFSDDGFPRDGAYQKLNALLYERSWSSRALINECLLYLVGDKQYKLWSISCLAGIGNSSAM